MSTSSSLQLGSIKVFIIRKSIKNLHLSLLPPMGRVRVTAPKGMKDDVIRTLIATRLPWIKKQQRRFVGQERQTKRSYVSGESHYFFGKRYRLELLAKNGAPSVFIKGKTKLVLQVRPRSLIAKRHQVIKEWYRRELRPIIEGLLVKWQKKLQVEPRYWGIMQMKTRWGTCNHKRKRILFNLELAKKPIACVEYVVVHELLHLIEKKHNEKFVSSLTKHLPKWKSIKSELNEFILSHEEW